MRLYDELGHLTADRVAAFTTGLVLRIGDGSVPGLPGIEGAPLLVHQGQVDEDGDGPVEFCRAVLDVAGALSPA